MYIEVLHDAEGNLDACCCRHVQPGNLSTPFFTYEGGVPEGFEQARVNTDTLTIMEIEAACGQKAALVDDKPEVVNIGRAGYIREHYKVDITRELTPAEGVELPEGMKVRSLVKRAP